MELDNYKQDILQNRYTDLFEKANEARKAGEEAEAARYYRDAAKTLRQLDQIVARDYSTQVEKLEEAAEILDAGGELESAGLIRDGTESEPAAGDDDRIRSTPGGGEDDEEDIRETLESFIVDTDVEWDDIGGLSGVKEELKQSVALGAIRDKPEAVTGADRILLFGPPGTGKTLLASAVAGSLDATFFEVKLGNLLSKYFGESSKQITALFDLAAELSPSVIFLDEIDSLTQSRDADLDESSRRVLTTLLSELSGLEQQTDRFVLVLGATNTPWDLDPAIRRRFVRRKLIPLPDLAATRSVVRIHTAAKGVELADGFEGLDLSELQTGDRPDGLADAVARRCVARRFTGSDIEALCQDAITRMIQRENPRLTELADRGLAELEGYDLALSPLGAADFNEAFERVSASLSTGEVERYDEWDAQFGT